MTVFDAHRSRELTPGMELVDDAHAISPASHALVRRSPVRGVLRMMRSALMMRRRPLSRFHRGFATTLFSDVVARSISAITTIVLIRFLAVGDYAFLVVFLAVGQFVGSAATGGLRMLYVRTEAERVARGTATEMPFGAVLAGGVAIIVVMALAGLLIAEVAGVGTPAERLYFVGLCAAFSIGQATVDLVSYHHQASLGFVKGGVVNVGRNVCLLAAAVVVGAVLGGSGPATAAALTAASLAAGAVASAKVFLASPAQRRIRGTRLGFTRESGWLTMYSLVAAGFATVDVFIVAVILSQKDVASFGAAQRYYAVALGAVPALEAVMRVRTAQPDIVESSTAQTATLTVWVKRSALPLALLVGMLALAARPVIPLIDHGRYPQSIPVFQVLLVGVFAYYLTLPAVNLLMAQRRFALLATAFGAAFAANAVGDFVLGPRLGIVAIAAVATTVLVLLSATVAICAYRPGGSRRVRLSFTSLRGAVYVAIISGACAIVGLAVASVPQPVLLLVAALVVCTLLAVVIKWGELGIAMFLVAVTPLIPVVSGVLCPAEVLRRNRRQYLAHRWRGRAVGPCAGPRRSQWRPGSCPPPSRTSAPSCPQRAGGRVRALHRRQPVGLHQAGGADRRTTSLLRDRDYDVRGRSRPVPRCA